MSTKHTVSSYLYSRSLGVKSLDYLVLKPEEKRQTERQPLEHTAIQTESK